MDLELKDGLETYYGFPKGDGPYGKIGPWGWLGLYASGAVLVFFLPAHIWHVHFGLSEPLGLKTTAASLGSPFQRMVEIGTMVLVLLHGLLGFRRIVLDLEIFKKRGDVYLSWGLVGLGLALAAWGFILFSRLTCYALR
jgi:succinate dehydrogenase hydrophobic anchor subunit